MRLRNIRFTQDGSTRLDASSCSSPAFQLGGKERERRDVPIYIHVGTTPTSLRPYAAGLPVIHGGLVTVEFGSVGFLLARPLLLRLVSERGERPNSLSILRGIRRVESHSSVNLHLLQNRAADWCGIRDSLEPNNYPVLIRIAARENVMFDLFYGISLGSRMLSSVSPSRSEHRSRNEIFVRDRSLFFFSTI